MSDKEMDREAVATKLNEAVALQYRTAIAYAVAAASLRGASHAGAVPLFEQWAAEELRGAQVLIEKVVAVGGQPTVEPAALSYEGDPAAVLENLVEYEAEGVDALHAVIADTGEKPESEALEHTLEHEIMRKHRHLDWLRRMVND